MGVPCFLGCQIGYDICLSDESCQVTTTLMVCQCLSGSPVNQTPPHLLVHNPHVLERLHKHT